MALGMRIAIKFALDLIQAAQDQGEAVGGGHDELKRPQPVEWPGPITQPLHSAVVGEGACFLLLPHHQADTA